MGGSNGRTVCLVLLETGGNQAFIFETNKLRENVGASQLTYRAGTELVLCAARQAAAALGETIEQALGHRIESCPVEPIILASGKALLLVQGRELGKAIVRETTRLARTKAPGLDLWGAVGKEFTFGTGAMSAQVAAVHHELERLRGRLRGPETRYLRLPMVASCETSGGPAQCLDLVGKERRPVLRSAIVQAKRKAAEDGFKRMRQSAEPFKLPESIEYLERLFEASRSRERRLGPAGQSTGVDRRGTRRRQRRWPPAPDLRPEARRPRLRRPAAGVFAGARRLHHQRFSDRSR